MVQNPEWNLFSKETKGGSTAHFLPLLIVSVIMPVLLLGSFSTAASPVLAAKKRALDTYRSNLPLVLHNYPLGIWGTVTYDGRPAAGIELDLYIFDDDRWSFARTTQTNAHGSYQFDGVVGLRKDQLYYVRFGPNVSEPDYVYSWYGPIIESYRPGEYIPGGDFDIADVPLIHPVAGADETLPVDFTWEKRNITSDTYRVAFLDPDTGDFWTSEDFGYTGSGTVQSLPHDIKYNKLYGWYVEVYAEADSFGESYMVNDITFKEGAQLNASSESFVVDADSLRRSRGGR